MAGALEELHADFAGDELLAFGDGGLKHFAFGRVPEAVVDQAGVGRDEAVAQEHDLAVHRDLLKAAVRGVEDGAAGGLVHAAGLHAHETVLDDVDAADRVLGAELVQLAHDVRGGERFAVDLHRHALFKFDHHVFRLVRGLGERLRHHGDVLRAFLPRILQDAALERDVQEVAVHGVRLLQRAGDRDVVLVGVLDHFGAGTEMPVRIAPGGDDLDGRVDGVRVDLETDLVVALAGRAVADGVRALGLGDLDEALGDERAGDGGAEEIVALVNGVGLHHREDEVAGEFLGEVFHVALGRAGVDALLFDSGRLFGLSDVGAVTDDFGVVGLLDPFHDDGGVKTSGVSDYDFHGVNSSSYVG